MPRKPKENEEKKDVEQKATKKNTTAKSATKKANSKAAEKKNSSTNKKTTSTPRKSTNKKASTTKKKESHPKKTTKKTEPLTVEYYDLPQRYNKTVIKLLAQTPKTLFIYWEISDDDINNYKSQFGENFFETTKPVLIIHNDTLNYSFEVEINDFANCWYLHVNDSKSDYRIELGRRPFIKNEKINTDYIYVTSSNEIESPNDHILFEKMQKTIQYRNVKTGIVSEKDISSLSFIKNMGKIYHIYDLYKELYNAEDNIDIFSNPSSSTSAQFK